MADKLHLQMNHSLSLATQILKKKSFEKKLKESTCGLFILITCQLHIVLILEGEILSWSVLGVKGFIYKLFTPM